MFCPMRLATLSTGHLFCLCRHPRPAAPVRVLEKQRCFPRVAGRVFWLALGDGPILNRLTGSRSKIQSSAVKRPPFHDLKRWG